MSQCNKNASSRRPTASVLFELEEAYKEACERGNISDQLLQSLKQCRDLARQEFCAQPKYFWSIVCESGNLELIKDMVYTCSLDLNQPIESEHPPLFWNPRKKAKEVIALLVQLGAYVNLRPESSGCTALYFACGLRRKKIAEELLDCGANVNLPDVDGETCLMSAALCDQDMWDTLIQRGAEINAQDWSGQTAFYHAIKNIRVEYAIYLLKHGADPTIRYRNMEDALILASTLGLLEVIEYLERADTRKWYSPEQLASAYELLGAVCAHSPAELLRATGGHSPTDYWLRACNIRILHGIEKVTANREMVKHPVYGWVKEFKSGAEVLELQNNAEVLHKQKLMICERVLGTGHQIFNEALQDFLAKFVPEAEIEQRLNIYMYMLEHEASSNSLLSEKAFEWAYDIVNLLNDSGEARVSSEICTAFLKLLLNGLLECVKLVSVAPCHEQHERRFDKLLPLVPGILPAEPDEEIQGLLKQLIGSGRAHTSYGNTLLHLSVSKANKSQYMWWALPLPSVTGARVLLDCGANVNAQNCTRNTPLHYALRLIEQKRDIVDLLLQYGAHPDCRNNYNESTLDGCKELGIRVHEAFRLTCFAARKTMRHNLRFEDSVPSTMVEFVRLH